MNISISIASEQPSNFIVRESLSAYPFYRFTCTVDSYNSMESVTLVADDKEFTGTLSGMDVSVMPNGKLLYNVGAVDEGCVAFDIVHPTSFIDTPINDIIASYGFDAGNRSDLGAELSIINTLQSDAAMVIMLSNLGGTPAFVDFKEMKILYYQDLYRQDPIEINAGFRANYSKHVSVGFTTTEPGMGVLAGNEAPAAMLPMGRPTALPAGAARNLVNNYNALTALFSKLQTFMTTGEDYALGSAVLSNLTMDKRIIAAKEAIYSVEGVRCTYWAV